MPVIMTLRDVHKIYQTGSIKTHALKNISFDVHQGDFTVFSGPSGSGKTTLLNLMGGLDVPTQGSVRLGEKEINTLSEDALARVRLMNFGFIFQAFNLVPVLTAKQNIEYIMRLQGVSAEERNKRTDMIARQLDVTELLNKRPNEMSGGQQQRIAVARAVVSRPKIVFADEPTANLDSENAENLLNLMKQLNEAEGVTFIFSTHDPRVQAKAKRQIHLKDGMIVS